MGGSARALRHLDEIQSLAQLEALDPARFALALEGELELAEVPRVLEEIDRFAQKSMRIRLSHSADGLPQKLRTLLQTTIVSYDGQPALLRERVTAILARLDPSLIEPILDAAARVLAGRATLRQALLAWAERKAAPALPAKPDDAEAAETDPATVRFSLLELD